MHYSLTRATIWNLVGYLYLIIASLISIPILVRSLGVTVFGQYSLIVATLTLVSSLNLGLPQAVVRALSHAHNNSKLRQTIWATSSLLFTLTGLFAASIATLAGYYLHVSSSILPLIFGLSLMSNLVAHYSTLPHAEGHFGYFNAKTFIVGTANTLLAAYLAYSGYGIIHILAMQLVCYLVSMFALAYFSLKYFPRPWQNKPTIVVSKSLISFGLKNQVGTLVGQIQAQYGKYLLATVSPLSLSAYAIAVGLVQKAAGGVVQVATAIYPATARGTLSTSFTRLYCRLQLGLGLVGAIGVVLYQLYGLPLLEWWLGVPEVVTLVHSVLDILVIYLAILVLTPLPSAILDGRGRPELTSLLATITTVVEIVVAFILFPRFGYLAPAYAALFAVALTTPALLFITTRVLQSRS